MSMPAQPKTTRQKPPQPKDDPSSAALISGGAAQQVVVTTITVDAAARHRADELDAEAAYYRRRAIQEQQALGSGYYVDLLRAMGLTGPRWPSGSGPERPQHHQRPADPAKRAFPHPPAIDPSA
jgi:hypothetical protein